MFDAFFNAIAALLAWFYELPLVGGSYFWAIALLTLTIMLIVTPLNVKATRSMMTMSAMAPEMKKIQQEFADDRQKMNEELLAFYRENKINPLGGCLPMILQIPFFIVLYQVIYGLTRRAGEPTTVQINNGTGEIIVPEGNFLPKYLDQFPDTQMYRDLIDSDTMLSVGIDLSRSAAAALQDSFVAGLPYMVMILVVAGTAFLQQKQMSARNPNVEMPQQQKILLRLLPVFFAVISFNFAAGLVVYFLISNVYRIFQNAAISMRLYDISGLQALLGVGTTNLATSSTSSGTDSSADKPPAKGSGSNKGSRSSKGSDEATSGASKDEAAKPGSKSDSAKPDPAKGGDQPKKRGDQSKKGSSSSQSKGGDGSNNGRPARPPSGRVTPPKSQGGGRATPPRRKKKRS